MKYEKWIVSTQNELHIIIYNEPVDIDEKKRR